MTDFFKFSFPAALEAALKAGHFSVPTPMQTQVVPPAVHNRDVIVFFGEAVYKGVNGCEQTAADKTAAFAIPLVAKLLKNPQKEQFDFGTDPVVS